MPKNILKVALDVPLDRLFDYLDGGFSVQIGQRVVVPFGRRNVVGVVIEKSDNSEFALEKLKTIIQVFDDELPIDTSTFSLLKFCADYYQYPFGQA
ncbi:MAG: Primosomal protein, partial [Pseudomonadota bacterium]